MPNARKGADLRRDPRFALHSGTVDPVEGAEGDWPHLNEEATMLVVEWWTPTQGLRRIERE
jgi:hypothetical protein